VSDCFLRSNRHDLGSVLAEGRLSTIYEACDTTLNRDVAINIMRPECQTHAANVLRFIRDAQITSQLQHTGILSPYEFGLNDQRQLYYTTRLIEGESLASVLRGIACNGAQIDRTHSVSSLMLAFEKVCDVIAYAHSRGVVHGALSSDRITLGAHGEVLVGHWCDAQIPENGPWTGSIGSHPIFAPPSMVMPELNAFTPPELIDADLDQISWAADVYALGGILYHILTLRPPAGADDEEDLKLQILHGLISSPLNLIRANLMHWHVGTIPEVLSGIAMKALQNDPAIRYSSVIALQEAVRAWQTNPARTAQGTSRARPQSDLYDLKAPCGAF
jgi:serine/threonine protein kinase